MIRVQNIIRRHCWDVALLWRLARLSVLLVFALANTSYGADEGFDAGFQNFRLVLKHMRERYEDPDFDQKEVLISALQGLNAATESATVDNAADGEVEAATGTDEVEASSASIDSGTEQYASLSEHELLVAIDQSIRSSVQSPGEIVDATPPSSTDLWNATISGLVNGLHDPYSQYLPPVKLDELNDFLSGEARPEDIFYGVGIHVDWDHVGDRGVMVLSPIPDGPAFVNDIRMGDVIIGVDEEPVPTDGIAEEDLQSAIDMIKGPENSEVRLTIFREGVPIPLEKTLKRAPVNSNQQIIRYMLDDGSNIGYVRLVTFNQHCARDVEEALEWLYSMGMKKLIFDLRFNPGGYLDQAVMVADLFLSEGQLITYTQGRSEESRQDFIDQRNSQHGFESTPMVIILNEYSASASEVVTGALKDSGRCDVVGATSFGKGSVQEVFPLRADAALRLTVAKYYTPADRCIHEVGIDPDYEVSSYLHAPTEDLEPGDGEGEADVEQPTPTPTPSPSKVYDSRISRTFDRDAQLKKAYEVLVAMSAQGEADTTTE